MFHIDIRRQILNNWIKNDRFWIEYLSIGKGEKVLVCVSNIQERNSMSRPMQTPNLFKCQLYMYALSLTLFHWLEVSMIITWTDYPKTIDFELQYDWPFHWMYIYFREITRVGRTRSTKFRCFLRRIKSGDIIPIHYKPQKFYNDDQPVYLVTVTAAIVEYLFSPLDLHPITRSSWSRILGMIHTITILNSL